MEQHLVDGGAAREGAQVVVVPSSVRKLAGFHGDNVLYPVWLSDVELLYVNDKSGFWNVCYARVDRSSSSPGVESDAEHRAVCAREQEIGGPHWVFGFNPVIVHRETRRVFMIFSGIQSVRTIFLQERVHTHDPMKNYYHK